MLENAERKAKEIIDLRQRIIDADSIIAYHGTAPTD